MVVFPVDYTPGWRWVGMDESDGNGSLKLKLSWVANAIKCQNHSNGIRYRSSFDISGHIVRRGSMAHRPAALRNYGRCEQAKPDAPLIHPGHTIKAYLRVEVAFVSVTSVTCTRTAPSHASSPRVSPKTSGGIASAVRNASITSC
jgi:hypothetical protein